MFNSGSSSLGQALLGISVGGGLGFGLGGHLATGQPQQLCEFIGQLYGPKPPIGTPFNPFQQIPGCWDFWSAGDIALVVVCVVIGAIVGERILGYFRR